MTAYPFLSDRQNVMETIVILTAQVTSITTQLQNKVTAAENNSSATNTSSTFFMTPCQLKVEDVMNYSDKVGLCLLRAVIEALPIKFDMKASETATFVEGMKAKAQEFGLSEVSSYITTFQNDTLILLSI